MKRFAVCSGILFLIVLSFTRCKQSDNFVKTDVYLNIIDWNLPDSSKVSVPFNIKLRSSTGNSCTHNLKFIIEPYDTITFRVYAMGYYENHGESCSSDDTYVDSTRVVTFTKARKFYFFFLKNSSWYKDSIIVTP